MSTALLCAVLLSACGDGAGSRPLAAEDRATARPPLNVPGPPADATSVLLISLDSTRRDLFGTYGHTARYAPGRSPSPNLDRLADAGVAMENAYATSSWTLPSHVSLLTGRPEVVHAVDLDSQRPSLEHPMLAEILREAGYRTAGFFSGPYLDPLFGFDRGFDRYESRYGPALQAASERLADATAERMRAGRDGTEAEVREAAVRRSEARRTVESLSHRDVSSALVTDGVLDELRRAEASQQPFFLFAHYFDPHHDYNPPAPYDEAFDPDYSGQIDGENFYFSPAISIVDPVAPTRRIQVASDRDMEHIRALYAGELAWTDFQIGRILGALDELGLRERTLVVVTADHGDEFFEHGSIGHRQTLFEEVLRVPLLLRLPDRLPEGRRVEGVVSLSDILPTILDLLGLHGPPDLASTSFLPLIRGEEKASERSAIGRIVVVRDDVVAVPVASGRRAVPARNIRVLETYRHSTLKITRERSLLRPRTHVPPEIERGIDALSHERFAEEKLRWIDLARAPAEAIADHSRDFTDPRARAGLQAFHDRYRDLLEHRGQARTRGGASHLVDALRALGYVSGDDSDSLLDSDDFALPPPGTALLDGDPGVAP